MGAPFAECLVLVAIHTYLGIHVLKRRVIFVDLALAQIAALGTTLGFLIGFLLIFLADPQTPAFCRAEGLVLLQQAAGKDFGYDSEKSAKENAAAMQRICGYLRELKRSQR